MRGLGLGSLANRFPSAGLTIYGARTGNLEGVMALRKAPAAPAARKTASKAIVASQVQPERSQAGGSNPTRLLREAAWSRMFGRIES